jgi:hypothetical protein
MSKWSAAERVDGMKWRGRSNGGERGIGHASHDLFETRLWQSVPLSYTNPHP